MLRITAGRAERKGDKIVIQAKADPPLTDPVQVQLVRYLPEQTVEIGRGENAGRVITMGFSVAPTEVNQFVITSKELDVRGSRLQNRKFQDVIDLVNEGKVDLRGSISHTWNFEDAQAAFDFVDSRDPSYRKGVLTFKK